MIQMVIKTGRISGFPGPKPPRDLGSRGLCHAQNQQGDNVEAPMTYEEFRALDPRTPNIPQLRKVVEWVETQEELKRADSTQYWKEPTTEVRWHQNFWVSQVWECGTTACFAGKTAIDIMGVENLDIDEDLVVFPTGEKVPVDKFAARVLGIKGNRQGLFDGSNVAADIRRIAESIAGEKL